MYMWQSHVENDDYSVEYFEHIATYKVLYHWASAKCETHTRIRYPCVCEACVSSAFSRSSALRGTERCDAFEMCERIIFDFYTGLSHMQIYHKVKLTTFQGLGTDESTLIEILCTRSNQEVEFIKGQYAKGKLILYDW